MAYRELAAKICPSSIHSDICQPCSFPSDSIEKDGSSIQTVPSEALWLCATDYCKKAYPTTTNFETFYLT